MYETKFTVSGAGEFPFDMLRHDQCCPVTGKDASQMHAPAGGLGVDPVPGFFTEPRRIVLAKRHSLRSDANLTDGRWTSFGWSIVDVETARKF